MCHIQCVPNENCVQAYKSSWRNPSDMMNIIDDNNSPYEISNLFDWNS